MQGTYQLSEQINGKPSWKSSTNAIWWYPEGKGWLIGYISQTDDITFENMKKAVVFGSIMASFCVEKFGTEQLQHVTKKMINYRLKNFVELVKTDLKSI